VVVAALRAGAADDVRVALPLVRADRHRVVDPRRPTSSLGGITTLGGLVDVVGRGLATGFGVGVLIVAGTGADSLAIIGIMAIGSALVSWSD
jgi:hypothetical protein